MAKNKNTLETDTRLPLIVAPMFLVSNFELVMESCKAGAAAAFPALNERTSADFERFLQKVDRARSDFKSAHPAETLAPYAVNLIVHKTNPRLQADLDLCVKYKVPIIITSLGAVPELVKKVHSYGGIVLHDVTNAYHAKKAVDAGVDGIIAVSAGAGGHAGTLNPAALVREIRKFFKGPLVLAGALSTGEDIAAVKALGADYAYMGTRFIATKESGADPAYKQMVCDASSSDIVYTAAISGIPANFLSQSLKKAGYDTEKLKEQGADGGKLKPIADEAKAWKTIWSAGHGVSAIDDIPHAGALIKRLTKEYQQAASRLGQAVSKGPRPPKP
jgi:nitronate monooxygenase